MAAPKLSLWRQGTQINPAIPPVPPLMPSDGNNQLYWAIGAIVVFFYVVFIWPRRHNALFNMKWMVLAAIVGAVEYLIFKQNNFIGPPAWGIILFSLVITYRARPNNSNRRISANVRRRVIAKWERKTGEKFNSRKYEIDHIVPFSRGGGHTFDNLRVIEKTKNRSKGAELPWWDIVGRIYRRILD